MVSGAGDRMASPSLSLGWDDKPGRTWTPTSAPSGRQQTERDPSVFGFYGSCTGSEVSNMGSQMAGRNPTAIGSGSHLKDADGSGRHRLVRLLTSTLDHEHFILLLLEFGTI